jgi:hypothetical protein
MFQNISPLCAEYHDTFLLEDDLMVPTFYLVKPEGKERRDLQKIETFLLVTIAKLPASSSTNQIACNENWR